MIIFILKFPLFYRIEAKKVNEPENYRARSLPTGPPEVLWSEEH
jgi:hypothetical protein